MKNNKYVIFIYLISTLTLSSCSLLEINSQIKQSNSYSTISGRVSVSKKYSDSSDIVVVLMKKTNQALLERISYILADIDGEYSFKTEPGHYVVGAFIDTNKDNLYQVNEVGDVYGKPDIINAEIFKTITVNFKISGKFEKQISYDPKNFDQTRLSLKNIGKVVSLKDEGFSRESASLGLWRPIDFLKKYGAGLFLLQDYTHDKIPIVFVHGANGSANDWKNVIESIDAEAFQPWVFNYPSGINLDVISDYLVRAMNDLQRKYNMKQVYVVAHSMGGLITRSFVMKYQAKHPLKFTRLKFVMTVNSPMMGMSSASNGVMYSPVVVSSWRDIAPGSDFLNRIHTWGWPKTLPYHLVFSYMNGESDDGVVSLDSQIPYQLQLEATGLYGFNSNHSGILKDKAFISRFNQILKSNQLN